MKAMTKYINMFRDKSHYFSAFVFVMLFLFLFTLAAQNITPLHYIRNISSANEMYMDIEGTYVKGRKVFMPYELEDLPPGTKVHLYNDFIISQSNMMYAKTVYSPMTVAVDGTEVYSYGMDGTFPSILNDPPTQVCLINIPASSETRHIEFTYEFPYDRDSLSLSAPLYGEGSDLMRYFSLKMALPFLCAMVQMFTGIFLLIMFIALEPAEVNAKSILWLGLFGLTVGLWCFCECDFTVLVIQQPFLLYVGGFMGMFSCTLPLLMYTQEIIQPKSVVLSFLSVFTGLAVCAAAVCQLAGNIPFHKSMFFFQYLLVINMITMSAVVFIRGIKSKHISKFAAAYILMTLLTLLETANYRFNIIYYKTLIFQVGVLIFLVLTEYFSGLDMRNVFRLKSQNKRLEDNMAIMEKQMNAQYESGKMLIETSEELKRQRHDLRHQYVVIDGFIDEKQYDRAKAYIAELIKEIPQESLSFYCRNEALNAIFTYYVKAAEENGIAIDLKLDIPEKSQKVNDVQLCILFGNMFENAIEACARVDENRFIKLYSYVKAGMLYIAMDNSCDGNIVKKGKNFISSKRGDIGTGLSSVTAIAEKHGGTAKFNADENIFQSSVCLVY